MLETQAAHSHTLGYDELLAAYVRMQFATEDFYTDPDIRMWIRQESHARRPDLSRWESYMHVRNLTRSCRGRTLKILLTMGAPHQFDEQSNMKWDGERDRSYAHCFALDPYKVRVYKSADSQAIVYFKDALHPYAVTVTGRGKCHTAVNPADVFNILLDTWAGGGKFAKGAQEFVCGAFLEDIDEAELALEESFDKSVAVMADGSSVIHADRIVFYSRSLHGGAYHVFAPDAFQEEKLLLGSIIERAEVSVILTQLVHPRQQNALDGIIKKLTADDPRQLIIRTKDGKAVFFCHHAFAPQPFPDGGSERPAPR